MPVQYRGILEEHRAVRERVGLFDLSHMGELFVEARGGRGTRLRALLIRRAQGWTRPVLDDRRPDGGILDDLIVYRLGEAPRRRQRVERAGRFDALAERLAGFKAVLDDRSLATALIAIQGPRSVDVLAPHTDVDLGAALLRDRGRACRGDGGARCEDRLHG